MPGKKGIGRKKPICTPEAEKGKVRDEIQMKFSIIIGSSFYYQGIHFLLPGDRYLLSRGPKWLVPKIYYSQNLLLSGLSPKFI
jgi:hypothetical protein